MFEDELVIAPKNKGRKSLNICEGVNMMAMEQNKVFIVSRIV